MPPCPRCGARLGPVATRCALCGVPLPPGGPVEPLPTPPPAAAAGALHLGTLMLVVALLAVCLAVLVRAPVVGVPLAAGAGLALARTVLVARRHSLAGRPYPARAAISTFLASLGLVAVAALWSVLAFGVTCTPIGAALFDTPFRDGDLALGTLVGLVAVGIVLRRFLAGIDLGDGP